MLTVAGRFEWRQVAGLPRAHVFAVPFPRISVCGHVVMPLDGPWPESRPAVRADASCGWCMGQHRNFRATTRWCSFCGRARPVRTDGTVKRHQVGGVLCPGVGAEALRHAPGSTLAIIPRGEVR